MNSHRSIRPLVPRLLRGRLTTSAPSSPPLLPRSSFLGFVKTSPKRMPAADVMSRGSPTRGQTTRDKDSKPVSPNQSINQANQPVLARPSTMVVEISMSALHQTKSLELQKVLSKAINYEIRKGTNQATQTLPLEVNGDKVPYITEDIDLIKMLYVFRGRRILQATILSAIRQASAQTTNR
ncbi:hypothetical protein OPV22_017258 [Ensete ventricosum]|uniref:Uncharacterized protein n=1 Tax=Ensete ventricosum TaxID=4639 RepID=A0AAV8R1S4_ENSVE|nr:hypothetical protein OPV22_017258 [Ensete ventricosum]